MATLVPSRVVGVADELGYHHQAPNRFRRFMQGLASTKVGAWSFSQTIAPVDRLCRRVTRGRTSVPQLLAGLPVMFVTTNGRKTQQPRTTPLIAVPRDGDLALIGTNFGQSATPGWVLNLEADPSAHVAYRGAEVDAVARPADDDEAEAIWAMASSVYPGYAAYRQRITERRVRIFVLEAPGGHQR